MYQSFYIYYINNYHRIIDFYCIYYANQITKMVKYYY